MNLKKIRHKLLFSEPLKVNWSLYELAEDEIWWRDRYSLFESRGYRLRDRLRPGWVPSWKSNPKRHPEDHEDTASSHHPLITHAARVSDGSNVIIKKIKRNNEEKSITVYLSSLKDQKKHCVPIIDSFPDEAEDDIEFLVMPLLRRFNNPSFRAVNEVIDFVKQTLEGVAFIHSKNIAHRDCSDLNIMLDGISMFPEGFHPVRQIMDRSSTKLAKYRSRWHLVTGRRCQVYVPELSDTIPYDPFAVDIYLLGDVYKKNFVEKYSNAQFLKPLVESMTQMVPFERPRANAALKQLENLVSLMPKSSLRWRLMKNNVGRASHFLLNISCTTREGVFVVRRMINKQYTRA